MSHARSVLPVIALTLIGSDPIAGGELEDWTTAKAVDTCEAWQVFVDTYPSGKLAGMARTRLDACTTRDEPPPPAQPTPPLEKANGPPVEQPPPGPMSGTPSAESFIVLPTSDGFVAVRRDPSTRSAEIGRRYPDQRIVCASIVRGQRLRYGDRWVHCPRAGGYIYATLLTPELTGAVARRFAVRRTGDGFVAVRSAATTAHGHRIAKLTPSQVVYCDRLVQGQQLREGRYWLHCPGVGGYIHAPLLIAD